MTSQNNIADASKAFAEFLKHLGLDKCTELDLNETATKTAELIADRMSGVGTDIPKLSLMDAPNQSAVAIRDIPFYSFCAHHFVPFFGTVSIDFVPQKFIAGLGGFSRIIDFYSKRPQFQEMLGDQIAQQLFEQLDPKAVRVQIRARQMCLELMGKGAGIEIVTTHFRGDSHLICDTP